MLTSVNSALGTFGLTGSLAVAATGFAVAAGFAYLASMSTDALGVAGQQLGPYVTGSKEVPLWMLWGLGGAIFMSAGLGALMGIQFSCLMDTSNTTTST